LFNYDFRTINSVEILEKIRRLCDIWEEKRVYATEFMNILRKIIDTQVLNISNSNYIFETWLSDYNDYLTITENELNESQKEIDK